MSGYKHISFNDRLKIDVMYNKLHYKIPYIADTLGKHYSTIYREIKRGLCKQLDSELREYTAYSSDLAQKDYDEKAVYKGAPLKIGKDHDLANYIEDKILNYHYSPAAVLGEIKAKNLHFETSISHTTLYRYIDSSLFLHLTNKDLPIGKRKRRKYKKVKRISFLQPLSLSIDDRPKEIETRQEFGHWEMDTVVGKAKGKSTCLLVLTERTTRQEIVMKIKQKSAFEVVKALDSIERRYKSIFCKVFKTITTDNGSEFADIEGLQKRYRTTVFKCHPYSSWERGSNENANKLIRRFIPKGTNISRYTNKQVAELQDWMNHYPRKILDYRCSEQLFNAELAKLVA